MAKHVHAEVIKAWADGQPTQALMANGSWEDMTAPMPCWHETVEYRIKPDPRAARDMAIAEAVWDAVKKAIFEGRTGDIRQAKSFDLAAIIASVKE